MVVRTPHHLASPVCRRPATTSASKALPSSINSSTLCESARSRVDNPCKSPAWRPEVALRVLVPIVLRMLPFFLTFGLFCAALFFRDFFTGVSLFVAAFFLANLFIDVIGRPAVLLG